MRFKLLLGTVLLVSAVPALAEQWDFVLVNKTGKTIKLVEIAQAGSGAWKKDIRDEEIRGEWNIKPGADYTVHFEKGDNVCKYDVRLTFDGEDTPVTWPGFDTCKYAFGDFMLTNGVPSVKGS